MAASPADSSSSSGGPRLTSYASRVPPRVLRGHVIMGSIQITVGCLLIFTGLYGFLSGDMSVGTRTFSGFWTAPFFIAAGATGLAGGRGRRNTQCCIVSCLVLSILASCVGFLIIFFNAAFSASSTYSNVYRYMTFSAADILWILLYLLEFLVAIVQAAFACRASCCCLPDAEDRQELRGFSGPAADEAATVTVQVQHHQHPAAAAAAFRPPPTYVQQPQSPVAQKY